MAGPSTGAGQNDQKALSTTCVPGGRETPLNQQTRDDVTPRFAEEKTKKKIYERTGATLMVPLALPRRTIVKDHYPTVYLTGDKYGYKASGIYRTICMHRREARVWATSRAHFRGCKERNVP